MRNICFKAKRLNDGEWIKGDLLHKGGKIYIYSPRINDRGFWVENEQVDPSTVCQFTGLKDKNGVEIWEHDILEDTDTNTFGELTFGCGVFAIDCLPISEYIYDGMLDLAVVCSKFDRKEGEK